MNRTPVYLLVTVSFLMVISSLAGGHDSSPHKAAGDHSMSEEAMKAQHERMANFKEAADMLFNAIIHGSRKMGHEQDMPHKSRSRAKEFHGLYVELGKRTENLKKAVREDNLPKAAVAYGR